MKIEIGTERFAEQQEDGTYVAGSPEPCLIFIATEPHDAFELGKFVSKSSVQCTSSGGGAKHSLTVKIKQRHLILYLFNSKPLI